MENGNWFTRLVNGPVQTRDVDGPNPGVIPPVRDDISTITVDTALSIGAVYRCVGIITSSISQMPLVVTRGGLEIPAPTIIKQPNIDESARSFIKQTVWSLATHGNAYWRVTGEVPNVQNLEVLHPDSVAVVIEDGKKKYYISGRAVPTTKIKHLRLEARPGIATGIGPIQRGTNEIIGALRLKNFSDNWFNLSGVPVGMLTSDLTLNADEAKEFAERWNAFIQEHGTAVLGSGMRYEYLSINPAEAQYLEITQSKTVAIARLFGVPATLLSSGNEGVSNTYSNQQELYIQFLSTTLVDYMNEIEDALGSLLPRGQEVNFKEEALLRMDAAKEVDIQVKQVAARLRTPNELRAVAGLPPLPGGDEFPTVASPNSSNEDDENGDD